MNRENMIKTLRKVSSGEIKKDINYLFVKSESKKVKGYYVDSKKQNHNFEVTKHDFDLLLLRAKEVFYLSRIKIIGV